MSESADVVPPLVVVDAANVVGARPDGWWRDRAGAARRLVESVAGRLTADAAVVVVLEGAARAGVDEGYVDGVRVVHAGGSGDDAIVDVVSAAVGTVGGRQITVVTADRGLRARVGALGADVVGPTWLWQRVDSGS